MISLKLLRLFPTFDDYLIQHAGRAFFSGPPLDKSVTRHLPTMLSRMVACRDIRNAVEKKDGTRVPAVMFLAVTGRCNLRCPHCYTSGYDARHMDLDLARRIVAQAYELGVSLVVVTGGEPLLNREFFDIPRAHRDMPFLIFTNGMLLPDFIESEEITPNMLWNISMDGPKPFNDARRGEGVHDGARHAMGLLTDRGLPFGFSATLSTDNLEAALTLDFVDAMAEIGCRAGFFLEQIPGPKIDPPLGMRIFEQLSAIREHAPIPLLGFPADEIRYGGCQAGGHGIVHISPEGEVEPCPAAHIAADTLKDVPLRCALGNPFFDKFRDLKEELSTGKESCTYAANAVQFQEALDGYGVRRTTEAPTAV